MPKPAWRQWKETPSRLGQVATALTNGLSDLGGFLIESALFIVSLIADLLRYLWTGLDSAVSRDKIVNVMLVVVLATISFVCVVIGVTILSAPKPRPTVYQRDHH